MYIFGKTFCNGTSRRNPKENLLKIPQKNIFPLYLTILKIMVSICIKNASPGSEHHMYTIEIS